MRGSFCTCTHSYKLSIFCTLELHTHVQRNHQRDDAPYYQLHGAVVVALHGLSGQHRCLQCFSGSLCPLHWALLLLQCPEDKVSPAVHHCHALHGVHLHDCSCCQRNHVGRWTQSSHCHQSITHNTLQFLYFTHTTLVSS